MPREKNEIDCGPPVALGEPSKANFEGPMKEIFFFFCNIVSPGAIIPRCRPWSARISSIVLSSGNQELTRDRSSQNRTFQNVQVPFFSENQKKNHVARW